MCEVCKNNANSRYPNYFIKLKNGKNLCGYQCSIKYRKNYNMDDIINIDDFNEPRPVTNYKKRDSFRFKSNEELLQFNEKELNRYYNDMENYKLENPYMFEHLYNIYLEDINTKNIEEEYEYSSEEDDLFIDE